jgi:hypothetical protein
VVVRRRPCNGGCNAIDSKPAQLTPAQ